MIEGNCTLIATTSTTLKWTSLVHYSQRTLGEKNHVKGKLYVKSPARNKMRDGVRNDDSSTVLRLYHRFGGKRGVEDFPLSTANPTVGALQQARKKKKRKTCPPFPFPTPVMPHRWPYLFLFSFLPPGTTNSKLGVVECKYLVFYCKILGKSHDTQR